MVWHCLVVNGFNARQNEGKYNVKKIILNEYNLYNS